MLDFAVRLTAAGYKVMPADLDRLRAVGFDDVGILQITLIASWFNYVNRVADALGLSRDSAGPRGENSDSSHPEGSGVVPA